MQSNKKVILQAAALRLKNVREQAGFNGREMASRLGLSAPGYNKNEQGSNFPGIDTLQALSEKFNISMDWFLFGKGPMNYKEKGEKEKQLEQRVKTLEHNLEGMVEESKKHEEALQERAGAIEMKPEVREVLDYMASHPVFYHELMLYFHRHKSGGEGKETTLNQTPEGQ